MALALVGVGVATLPSVYWRWHVERTVGGGATLPRHTPRLEAYEYHSLGGNSFRLFARFEGGPAAFEELVTGFGLSVFGASPPAPCLPHAWGGPETVDLGWWTPSTLTPHGLAGSRRFGTGSWITAKQEAGHVFIVIVANRPEATNGPF